MNDTIVAECKSAIQELCEVAKLKCGDIVVVGCSTSEVLGSKVGTNSDPDTAKVIFQSIHDFLSSKGIYLAAQCCEHLNSCDCSGSGSGKRGGNCQCHPAAEGGRFFRHRSVPQFPGAGCGGGDQSKRWIGIGATLIGMHLKKVAVPVRLRPLTLEQRF